MCTLAYIEMNLFGIITLAFFWYNQRRTGDLSLDERLFNTILFTIILELVMDSGQWALERASFEGSYSLQVLSYTLGDAIGPLITYLWVMYCDIRVNMDEHGLKKRVVWYTLPLFINILFLVANLFTPLVFRIDSAHVYHRERFFWVYTTLMYLYGFVSLLFISREAFKPDPSAERTEFRSMSIFVILPFVGGLLQWLFYGLSITWMCMVLSIIMLYTRVLSRQILIDPLTGLNNRRKLNQYLSMKINSIETNQTLFLMIMDADDFKGINDRFGHTAGDRALVAIADILKSVCMGRDFFLARFGGDEFLVAGHGQNEANPEMLIHKIEEQIEELNATTSEPFQLSLSIGWALFKPKEMRTIDALLNEADQSLYQVKRSKKLASRNQ